MRRSRGFTLIEVIIFIVIVGVGVAGILSVFTNSVKASSDPMVRKQTLAIAESLLEEILLKEYCDPDTWNASTIPPTCGALSTEVSRNYYDDVIDYNGYSTTGIVDSLDVPVPGLAGYNVSVLVGLAAASDNISLAAVGARKITVSVTGPQGVISLVGYRAAP